MTGDFWLDRKVFVTGASGFLAPWLINEIVSAGANVTVLERDIIPSSNLYQFELYKDVNRVRGDLCNYGTLLRALNEFEIDTIFHLGAQPIVTTANRNPTSTFESNIRGTWNLLEAARQCKLISRIVIASSDKAYGTQPKLPYTEDAPLQGEAPYDVSKSCVDMISKCYFKTYGLPVVVTRCGNFYGGGDLNFNRIVPGTIRSILRKTAPVIRSDGKFVRDYIYVKDVVEAYITCAMNAERKEVKGQAFNFSTEEKHTVMDIVNLILELMKSDLKPTILNEASNEIREQYLSSQKARDVLGWKSKYCLREGLLFTINWYQNFLNKTWKSKISES